MLDDGAADRVVVVDNGSTDDSVAVLRRDLPEATVIVRASNGGFAAGANAGIRHADADVVVLLNNDAEPAPGFVAALRDHLDAAPAAVAAVTGRIVLAGRWSRLPAHAAPPAGRALRDHDGRTWVPDPDGEVRLNSTGVRVDRDGNGADRDWFAPADHPAERDVFGFSGGASALRVAALEDVGLLDESLFMYYEDTELAWRLDAAGGAWSTRPTPSSSTTTRRRPACRATCSCSATPATASSSPCGTRRGRPWCALRSGPQRAG